LDLETECSEYHEFIHLQIWFLIMTMLNYYDVYNSEWIHSPPYTFQSIPFQWWIKMVLMKCLLLTMATSNQYIYLLLHSICIHVYIYIWNCLNMRYSDSFCNPLDSNWILNLYIDILYKCGLNTTQGQQSKNHNVIWSDSLSYYLHHLSFLNICFVLF